jgi:hypothetical protein
MLQPEEELYKRVGMKAGMSGFHASVRILTSASSWRKALDLTNGIQVAFNVFKDVYGNWFENRRMFVDFFPLAWNAPFIHWLWKNRINGFFHKKDLFVEKELAGLFHFPDSRYNKIPIIQWITYKVLPPPPNNPREGILLGMNRYRAIETPIHFLDSDRTRHEYIIGKSGSGKSALLNFQARQDVCLAGFARPRRKPLLQSAHRESFALNHHQDRSKRGSSAHRHRQESHRLGTQPSHRQARRYFHKLSKR